jgi:hypothetical protein
MECVTTIQYSVHFNNVPLCPFKPTRGLHQGDPLSPFLLLFVVDGLSKLLQHEVQQRNLQELHICRRGLGISHLLFADDTLLFFPTKENQAQVVHSVLRRYEKGTGQLINPSKCSMMFGTQCLPMDQEKVMALLSVENVASEEKCLGLPTHEGRLNKSKFRTTKDRMSKKFMNWAECYMSVGAKEVLIKSVAQAIPTYVMGVFKLPSTLCEEVTGMVRYFW